MAKFPHWEGPVSTQRRFASGGAKWAWGEKTPNLHFAIPVSRVGKGRLSSLSTLEHLPAPTRAFDHQAKLFSPG
jgi:hypothetical protein